MPTASSPTPSSGAFSRRSALAALAGAAAAGTLAQAPRAAAAPAAVPAATTSTGSSTGPAAPVPDPLRRAPVVIDGGGTWPFTPHPAGTLTTRTVTSGGLALTEVLDSEGVLATLTKDAKTVTVRGPRRWFTEQKKDFTDEFHRDLPDNTGWGSSPGGGKWDMVNGQSTDYDIDNERGVVKLTTDNSARYGLLLDDEIGDLDVTARFSFARVPTGAPCSLALVFTADPERTGGAVNNHYRARLILTTAGQVQLVLEKEVDDQSSELRSPTQVGTGYQAYEHWYVRVVKAGPHIRAHAWKKDTPEPPTWVEAHDTTFAKGRIGIRALASAGSTGLPLNAYVYDIAVTEAYWAEPPVVSHDTWVRLLPAKFDGQWTPELEQRIRAWAADTSPDALAYASALRAFGTPVTSAAQGGAQVLGESGYSPRLPDGTRRVGADFNHYMGLPWDYPAPDEDAKAAPTTGAAVDPDDPDWKRNLDCSGYVRMVYGYHMGIPMVHSNNFGNGNLPRTSADQNKWGPGVTVIDSVDVRPSSLAGLRIGDVVFFDATGSKDDPETPDGKVDHTGIYMGRDQHGDHRFASSRRTPNGPTMADLGATSILNKKTSGKELYPDSLRRVRRF
ncbi:hypothetical protein ACIQUQ_10210 [Streptomyces sp. NPDC101118]|uniref:hypothetical protein n=1 Tax=Streptomyces sp. NPDC101118 TaxID=3366109 RepID=UPI00382997D1